MRERLIIVGAGGFGREIASWAVSVAHERSWDFAGFLDQDPQALDGFRNSQGIIADPNVYDPEPEDRLIPAIADPKTKLAVCRTLEEKGGHFTSLVHPTALIGANCTIARGVVLCPYVTLTCDIEIGSFVTVNAHSTIGHDAIVDDGCTLSSHCDVTGNIHLMEGVLMGSHSSIIPRLTVGKFARIGAGSVVMRNVPEHVTVVGVPAKTLMKHDDSENGSSKKNSGCDSTGTSAKPK